MRAQLSLEALYAIPLATWEALFTALGAPESLARPATSHAAIADAIVRCDLPAPLARALAIIESFATETGRNEIHTAAAAIGHASKLPIAISPADLVASIVAAAPRDHALAAILDAAKILRARHFPSRLTYVFSGDAVADSVVGEPTQYATTWSTEVSAWCAASARGNVVAIDARGTLAYATFDIAHEGRAENVLTRDSNAPARVASTVLRRIRSHVVTYDSARARLSVTTDDADAVLALVGIAGRVFFSDARHFLKRSPFTLWPLQQKGSASLDVATAGGEVAKLRAISGTWHSGKNHAVTPRGTDFFEALERYKIKIDGGRLDAVTLRAELRTKDGSPATCDVSLRPPFLLTCSEPEAAHVMNEALDLAHITRPQHVDLDFFALQPWIQTRALWQESVGDAFDALVESGALVADAKNRTIAHPEHPYAGKIFTAYPLVDGRFLAVSPEVPIAPFVVRAEDLVVYRLAFAKLAEIVAEALGLDAPANGLDDDGVLYCGRRAIGPTHVLFIYSRDRFVRPRSIDCGIAQITGTR